MAEKKDDRRTVYSKRVIREALFSLMCEKPLNRISVTEICELADVNRSTFYKYYEDIFDLHKKILRDFFAKQHEMVSDVYEYIVSLSDPMRMTKKDFYGVMLVFFRAAYENRDLYKFIYNHNASNNIHYNTGNVLYRKLSPLLKDGGGADDPFITAYNFVVGGVTALLMEWLDKDCAVTPEDMAKRSADYCYGVFCAVAERALSNKG